MCHCVTASSNAATHGDRVRVFALPRGFRQVGVRKVVEDIDRVSKQLCKDRGRPTAASRLEGRRRETHRLLRRLYGRRRSFRLFPRAYHRTHVWQPTKLDRFPDALLSVLMVGLAACGVDHRAEARNGEYRIGIISGRKFPGSAGSQEFGTAALGASPNAPCAFRHQARPERAPHSAATSSGVDITWVKARKKPTGPASSQSCNSAKQLGES
jgi:hypothetical protein